MSDEYDFDFLSVSRKWQAEWVKAGLFEPQARGGNKFFFTVPYPYVSGLLHVGHGRTYTNGDVVARYKRMAGFNVLWPMAFHITGTPVLAISSKIAAGDEATVRMFEEYVAIYEKDASKVPAIVKSFSDPWGVVNYFSGKLVDDFRSMGFSLDMSRQFTTGDAEYNRFIEWQFHKYRDSGFLKQAAYPILYCVRDENAVGEDDIKDADTDPVEVQKFTAFKFALGGGDGSLVSCTLRPDTVFGITNMFVNPDADYVRVKVAFNDGSDEDWWVSEKAAEKLAYQDANVIILDRKPGTWFVGRTVMSPVGDAVPVLPASFVDASHASGFVHSVPAHAPFDYAAIMELANDGKVLAGYPGLKEKVAAIVPRGVITVEGFGEIPAADLCGRMKITNTREKDKLAKATKELYKAEYYGGTLNSSNKQFSGKKAAFAKAEVSKWLVDSGKARFFFENSRPASCRCGGEVVSAVMRDQWFIDYNAEGWKEKSRKCLDGMAVFPEAYRKQFSDVFDWLDKRPCARRRGLGTRLPFDNEWIIESLSDSTIYMAFYTIIKAIRKHKITPAQLTIPFFDYVYLGNGKVADVAKSTKVPAKALDEIRAEFLYWYPNDQRHTGTAHITNHLSFFVFAHTAIFPEEHWPKAITLNELVISEGTKMSKSKGNVVLLNKISSQVGADVFRLYAAGAADFGSLLDYRSKDVESTKRLLRKWTAIISQMDADRKHAKASRPAGVAAWFASKFNRAVKESTLALDGFRLRDYVQIAFYQLLNDYDYFVRRANDDEKAAVAKLAAESWIALMAPVVPHACEELWHNAGCKGFVSVAKWPVADAREISDAVESSEDAVNTVLADARKIAQLLQSKGKKPTKLLIITASNLKRKEFAKALSTDTSDDAAEMVSSPESKDFMLRNFHDIKPRAKLLDSFDEGKVLEAAKGFLGSQLSLAVTVEGEEKSANPKAPRAMPLRPALVLE